MGSKICTVMTHEEIIQKVEKVETSSKIIK